MLNYQCAFTVVNRNQATINFKNKFNIFSSYFFNNCFQNCDQDGKDIMECLIKGQADQKYSEKVRAFALTLHFHSPRGYAFVRKQFNNHLPHECTIRKWYQMSNSNGEPGFCKSNMDSLKILAKEFTDKGQSLICALSFDEMSIRRHIQWSDARKQFIGRVDYGFNVKNDALPVAKNAIVFMINGVSRNFNLPIAFFFIDTLNASERKHLLLEIITALTELNVRLISVTFDGLSTNIPMCVELGACFQEKKFQPYFYNHITRDKIYVILDPSHMEKLVRNTLASEKILYDASGAKIEWKYFELLEKFRTEHGLTLTHKLNKKHIQWDRNKMKVSLAVETLSASVADSMEFLMKNGYEEFADCSATIKFIRYFNNIFDILNSKKSDTGNEMKSPLSPSNSSLIFSFFKEAIIYIKALKKADGKLLISSKQRIAFKGFVLDMYCIESIYKEFVETNFVDQLYTFRFSQDPLESLFGRIRSLNGFNDNPTVQQFCAAIRKVSVNIGLRCAQSSNCKDSLDILTVPSNSRNAFDKARRPIESHPDLDPESHTDDDDCSDSNEEIPTKKQIEDCEYLLDCPEDINVAYVAGLIETNIEVVGRFECEDCLCVFSDNDKIPMTLNFKKKKTPCKSTYHVCKIANRHLKYSANNLNFKYNKLLNHILRDVNEIDLFPKTNFESHPDHKYFFIKYITEEFLRIQATYMARTATLEQQKGLLRNKLKKAVTFAGE